MQNAVPKAFRTAFLKSSKTKTKTKYLLLTFSAPLTFVFEVLFREVMKKVSNQSSSSLTRALGDFWLKGRPNEL